MGIISKKLFVATLKSFIMHKI